jgi:outer membrane receptor protein involved in Fe transport
MLRKIYLLTAAVVLGSALTVFAQTGSIKGKVIDKTTKEPLPFANVIAEINGQLAGGAQTDFDGNFTIKPLQPGKYDLKATFVGYTTASVTGVIVSADKITFQDVSLTKGAVDITAVDITTYKNPIIDKGNPSTQTTITQEEIQVAPTRDVKSVASTTAGVYQRDEGDDVNVRGSRSDATDYYVDGIKVRGSTNLPQSGIEQVTVVTGGVPAQYGDATGGIINITTRGPSKEFFGGIEYATSELFDKYGYNLIGGNISGPLLTKKSEDGKIDRAIIGFFFSGEYQTEKDPDPSATDIYKVKDDIMDDLKNNPLTSTAAGGTVFRYKSEFLNNDSFEETKIKLNTPLTGYRFSGKFDIQPVDNLTITLGGSYDHSDRSDYSHNGMMYNYDNNRDNINTTWRVFARLTQRLGSGKGSDENSASTIKNAFYSVQVDYTHTQQTIQDPTNKDNFFDYGYVGKFETVKAPSFRDAFTIDPATGDTTYEYTDPDGNGIPYAQVGNPNDTIVNFTPGNVNQYTQAYTSQYYQLAEGNYQQYYNTLFSIAAQGGLINGQLPRNTYSLWNSVGTTYNLYQEFETNQFRVSAQVSADIKDHAIVAGFEYEQRQDRSFGINPVGLWGLARLKANEYNQQPDYSSPIYVGNTVLFPRSYNDPDGLPGFYQFLRERLVASGVPGSWGNTDYIDVDALDRSLLSLDLFTADELLNSGNNFVAYSGYDYKGNKQSTNPSFDDFWTAKDENGNFTRPIGSFNPIYMAGYIQDRFAINDLIFNVGVRVDYFDANQKVLKDKYLLYPAKTAGEVAPERPSNIEDSYIVYVDDVNDPANANIIGYRDGDNWYDANGAQVSNPGILELQAGGTIAPYLVDPALAINGVQKSIFKPSDSFEDYNPSVSVMPRVAFSFPISDEALFFAHYDVLTQRPPTRSRSNPLDYYFIESQGALLNNPALKPEKTTDYELGFKQTLSKSSAITISAFYRELRDMIQQTSVNYAFPTNYLTFDNIDFGTVKGFTFGYDLRRTGNVRLTANYTLQFADGTGSGDRTSDKLLQNGFPNLKTIAPLDFDQRHNIVLSVDYRYGSGTDYNGPMIGNSQFLSNTGLNVVFRAGSGTPYSRQSDVTTEANNLGLQQVGSGFLDGSINGARLPWQFRIDLKLDKDFELNFGKDDNKKKAYLNVYIQVQNLLDADNIISVYRYTGNPDDDGYLASAVGQQAVAQQTDPNAFEDQYNIKVNNPNNYSLPRRARLGIKIDF